MCWFNRERSELRDQMISMRSKYDLKDGLLFVKEMAGLHKIWINHTILLVKKSRNIFCKTLLFYLNKALLQDWFTWVEFSHRVFCVFCKSPQSTSSMYSKSPFVIHLNWTDCLFAHTTTAAPLVSYFGILCVNKWTTFHVAINCYSLWACLCGKWSVNNLKLDLIIISDYDARSCKASLSFALCPVQSNLCIRWLIVAFLGVSSASFIMLSPDFCLFWTREE